MGLRQDEKELIFLQSKESMQEVVGWKIFIFLPHSTTWKFFMIGSIILKFVYVINLAVYMKDPYFFDFVNLTCDLIYCLDTILAVLHFFMGNTRKLKEGKRRHAFWLFIDCISLLPLEMTYEYCVYNTGEKSKRLSNLLGLIGILRIYQVPKNFSNAKDSIYKLEVYVIVTVFQVLSYFVILTHCLSCFIFLYFTDDQKKSCLDEFLFCVIENSLETFYLLGQSYISPCSNYPLHEYKVLLIVDFLLGYIFTYAFVMPLLLFVSLKFLYKYFEYSRNLRHMSVLTGRVVKNKKLRRKVLEYYREARSFGRSDQPPEILNVFPLCLKKYIFCDMHWEAMRHSFLLQDLSLGCKRSLSLHMRTEFLLPKAKLFEKGKNPTYFLYLESGLLQIMAEENSRAPVLSLSGGTVLGEISYFLHRNSMATVAAARFSIIHTLSFRSLFKVLADYPSDKRKVLHRVKVRLKFARSKHEIKTKICSQFAVDINTSKSKGETKRGNIKWIKSQFRAIYDLKKVEELMEQHQNTIDDYERRILNLDTQMTHTSVYLPFLSVNEENAHKREAVCLKKYPWLMDPHCQFVLIWGKIIRVLALLTILIYPLYIGWFPHIPDWFFVMSWVITFMFMNDIMLQFTTAFKNKNHIVKKFSSVVLHRTNRLLFGADILAAFPLQILAYNKPKRFLSNLYFVNALFKVYTLIPAINKWNYSPKARVFVRTMTKFIFYMIIMIYLAATVFYVTGVECVFYDCGDHDWYQSLVRRYGEVDGIYCAILKALYLGYEMTGGKSEEIIRQSFLICGFLFLLFHLFLFALRGECTAAYVLELAYDNEYKRRMDFVFGFMGKRKMVGHVRDRVMAAMEFQWRYDEKNDITEKRMFWETLSQDLRGKIYNEYVFPVLAKSKLFASEDESFLTDLCKKASHLALPANSVLLTLGSQTGRLFIIQRGWVQINSFIVGDLNLNISKPIWAKEGDTFPVIDVFSQTPAAISAVTVTECELLVLDLEDVLSTMMIHGIFKDFVETVKNTDLSALTSAKLAVSEYKYIHSDDGVFYRDVFTRLKGLGVVLRILLGKQSINSHSHWYVYWELSRVLFILVSLIAWPIALACCTGSSAQPILLKLFFAVDVLSLADFYIRLRVAYYNNAGIYVSHTLYTSSHYMLTTFITDLASFTPSFHILYIIIHENYDIQWFVILVHFFLRSLSLYRVVGFLKYLKLGGRTSRRTQFISVFCFFGLGIHYYICLMVHFYIVEGRQSKFRLTKDIKFQLNRPYEYYLNELGLVFALGMRSTYFLNDYDLYSIVLCSVLATVGIIGTIWLFSHLTLSQTTSNKNLATYQYHMQSFLRYLSRQKTDDKIISQAMEHFEYEWEQQLGYDPQKVFSTLPHTVHEDVMFLLYRKTLRAIGCLSEANEYFFRVLSRNVKEVFLKRGSLVIFQKEVQSNIFFIHAGQCLVENSSQILFKGAMIGDIKGQGIMKNTIMAKTEVMLLRIPSKIFFTTLNNFHSTRLSFQSEVAHLDDFIASVYIEEQDSFSDTFTKEKEELESEFVLASELDGERYGLKEKKKRWYLRLESKTAKFLRFFFMFAAYLTVNIIPIFMAIRVISPLFLFFIYALDVIWIAEIILNSRFISSVDKKKYIHRGRNKIYLRLVTLSKAAFRILAVFPTEIIPLVHYGVPVSDRCCYIMCICYVNRLLRIFPVFLFFRKKRDRLLVNFYMNALGILMFSIAAINIFCSIKIGLSWNKEFEYLKCYESLNSSQRDALLRSYLCILNDLVGGGMEECLPATPLSVFFQFLITTWSLLSKSLLISYVLMIVYLTHHNKSYQMLQLEHLDNYLTVRDVSPILRTRAQKYFCSLLNSFHEGANTSFLNSVPPFIRSNIMQDLYMRHVSKCFVFQDLDVTFLKQLTTRLYINIFFPGDYITERGDVDHNIYFIQKGEVYCIQTDKYYKALEKATDLYISGDSFGILQGIFPAYPHKQTYRAKTLTTILVLNYYKWEDLRIAFPEVFESIYKSCMQSVA